MDKTSENKQKYKGSGFIMRILKNFSTIISSELSLHVRNNYG